MSSEVSKRLSRERYGDLFEKVPQTPERTYLDDMIDNYEKAEAEKHSAELATKNYLEQQKKAALDEFQVELNEIGRAVDNLKAKLIKLRNML